MSSQSHPRSVALIGNPNTGKSTLFSALAGTRQQTGNYPGVTVEKKLGKLTIEGKTITLIDLPGTYSLAPRSPDEMVAVDVLLGRRPETPAPDAVICILDASNLERNLYLLSQVLEMGLPVVVALNMTDIANKRGVTVDVDVLAKRLGVPVIATQANRRVGINELRQEVLNACNLQPPEHRPFPDEFRGEVTKLADFSEQKLGKPLPRFLAERLLLDTSDYLQKQYPDAELRTEIDAARARLAEIKQKVPSIEAISRYRWAGEMLQGAVQRTAAAKSFGDKLDQILTHRIWGTLIFAALMLGVFYAIFTLAGYPMDAIEWVQTSCADWVSGMIPEGAMRSLIVDGLIGGVGSVVVFLPQICILFLFIAILEDCGYMARAAYLMDKLMTRVGLSGKSFIPLLSSFACAIPGIMATRTIENRRDRLVTILIAPLMSCSARLPVYILLTEAFFPEQAAVKALIVFAMYLVGIIASILVALVLKWTILPGSTPPFVMELPIYKVPSLKIVAERVFGKGWAFLKRAGTLIFAVTVLVWAAGYFPRAGSPEYVSLQQQIDTLETELEDENLPEAEATEKAERLAALDNEAKGLQMQQSVLGRAGKFVEPVVMPLGWDWRIGCAAIASFPAREVVIGTLGVIYNLGDEEDEESQPLKEQIRTATWDGTDKKVYTLPVAFSLMVFFALCAQCGATLVTTYQETNHWFWPVFTFTYMTALAYVAALATYQVGTLLGF